MVRWICYESGIEGVYTLTTLYKIFYSPLLKKQRKLGTEFEDWIAEMEHMQILIKV